MSDVLEAPVPNTEQESRNGESAEGASNREATGPIVRIAREAEAWPWTATVSSNDGVAVTSGATTALIEKQFAVATEQKVLALPVTPRPQARLGIEPLQEWEGIVDWVDGRRFGAVLTDLTHPGTEEEQVEFSFEELASREDESHVAPGAVLYWTIGLARTSSGQRMHVSLVRFRRLPAWTKRELAEAQARAEAISRKLGFA